MPATKRTSAAASPKSKQAHATAELAGITPSVIKFADKQKLMVLQKLARLGDTWGVLRVPDELQTGLPVSPLHLTRGLPKDVRPGSRQEEFYVTEMMRAAIAMALVPTLLRKPNKHTTIRVNMANLQRLMARRPFSMKRGRMWRNIVLDGSVSTAYRSSIGSLSYYYRIGCLPDQPQASPTVQGGEAPRDRTGEPEHTSLPISVNQIQPYSDEFVAEAGWAAATMIQLVGPTLLDAVEAALKVKPRIMTVRGPKRRLKAYGASAIARDPVISSWKWTKPDGTPLLSVPVSFHIPKGLSKVAASWPPRTFEHAIRMVQILQGAHAFPIALATGNRHGEIASLEIGSLSRLKGGLNTTRFRTWKLEGPGGRNKDAPVPTLTCEAILQQERLVRIFRSHYGFKSFSLWFSPVKPGRVAGVKNLLNTFVDGLGLRRFVTKGGVNPHRFRKTLARLAALALVHAPKILMDAFGHRDEQMTILRYILSDPGLLSEVQEVVRELIILKGVEAIETCDRIRGSGSEKLRARVHQFARRLGESALEPNNVAEFARAMTEEGTSWAIVAPGIVCTSFKTGGLCNKGRGAADPHYCNPACENQLIFTDGTEEYSRAVLNAIETVDYALGLILSASKEGDEMLVAQYRGQIRSLLNRWPAVDAHFASSKPFRRLVPGVVLSV